MANIVSEDPNQNLPTSTEQSNTDLTTILNEISKHQASEEVRDHLLKVMRQFDLGGQATADDMAEYTKVLQYSDELQTVFTEAINTITAALDAASQPNGSSAGGGVKQDDPRLEKLMNLLHVAGAYTSMFANWKNGNQSAMHAKVTNTLTLQRNRQMAQERQLQRQRELAKERTVDLQR